MDVVNITAYAYKYGVQYPVQIPIIRSTALIEHVREQGASTFERDYQDLHEGAMDATVKNNFDGFDLWAAVKSCPQYYMYYPYQGAAGLSNMIKLYNLLGIYVKRMEAPADETQPAGDFIHLDRIVSVLGEDYYDITASGWMFAAGLLNYSSLQIINYMSQFSLRSTK